jgi:hypothetical protein
VTTTTPGPADDPRATPDPARAVLLDGIARGLIECDGDPDDPGTRFRLTPAGIRHAEQMRVADPGADR